MRQHRCSLISVHKHHTAVVVAYGYAHTVCVRVGCEHQVGAHLVSHLQREGKGGRLFRVRRNDSREVAVADILLRNVIYVLEAHLLERLPCYAHACSVERGIDYLQVAVLCHGLRREGQGTDVAQIEFVHVGSHYLYLALHLALGRIELDHGRVSDGIDLGHYVLVHRRGYLSSV